MNKKGQFANLQNVALGLMVFIVLVALTAQILGGVQDTQETGSMEYNITGTGLESTEDLANWTPTIVVISIAVVIIGMLILFQGRRR